MKLDRIHYFIKLSAMAGRVVDARHRGPAYATPAGVALADMTTSLYDLRAAHTMACDDVTPDDLQTCGILTMEATLRRHREQGGCPDCGRRPRGHGGGCD